MSSYIISFFSYHVTEKESLYDLQSKVHNYDLLFYSIVGVSIAFSIAEQLLASSAYTLFVTHYPQLTSLSTMYSNVKNVHLRTSLDMSTTLPLPLPHHGKNTNANISNTNTNNSNLRNSTAVSRVPQSDQKLKFLYQVTGGPCDMKSG